MIQAEDSFHSAIKSTMSQILVKVVFEYETERTLINKDIISMSVSQKGENELGCLEDDRITLEFLKSGIIPSDFGLQVPIRVYFGIKIGGSDQWVCIGRFKITRWKKNDHTYEIEAGSTIPEDEITDIFEKDSISLKSYISSAASFLGIDFTVGSVCDGTLSKAYLYYKTIKEQLKSFSFASQGIIRSTENGLELEPYKFGEASAVYNEGKEELILDKSGNTFDTITQKAHYKICRSMFTEEEDSNLYSASGFKAFDDYPTLKFDFSSPSKISHMTFTPYCYFNSIKYGLFGGSIDIGSGYSGETTEVDFQIIGNKISSNVLGASGENTTFISNPYIQTSTQIASLSLEAYYGDTYSFKSRIDPTLQIGDTITISGVGDILVTSISYKFDGSLVGTIGGILKKNRAVFDGTYKFDGKIKYNGRRNE